MLLSSLAPCSPFFVLVLVTLLAAEATLVPPLDWSRIHAPPSFVHELNPRIIYFPLEFKSPNGHSIGNGNGGHHSVVEHEHHRHYRERTLHCAASGNPAPT